MGSTSLTLRTSTFLSKSSRTLSPYTLFNFKAVFRSLHDMKFPKCVGTPFQFSIRLTLWGVSMKVRDRCLSIKVPCLKGPHMSVSTVVACECFTKFSLSGCFVAFCLYASFAA